MADVRSSVRLQLDRYGLTSIIGEDRIYDTVSEALEAFHAETHAARPLGSPKSGSEPAEPPDARERGARVEHDQVFCRLRRHSAGTSWARRPGCAGRRPGADRR